MSNDMSTDTTDDSEAEPEMGDDYADDVEERVEDALPDESEAGAPSIGGFLQNGGIKRMLLQEDYHDPETGHSYSKAHLVADVINVMRMDAKQLAATHGIDIEVSKMSPERAAELLEGVAQQDGMSIIEVFQDIEDYNDEVLQKQLTEEQHDQYMTFKENMLYSVKTEGE